MIRCQFCHQNNPTGTACCARCGAPLSRPERSVTSTPELEKQIRTLLKKGSLIEAIKRFRQQTGAGLKEAKDVVERLAAAHGLAAPRGTGYLNVLLLAAMLIIELFLA